MRTHGKVATYNAGCRCDLCRKAGNECRRVQRYLSSERLVPAGAHGKATTYQNRMCRCDECYEASQAAHEEWRRRRVGVGGVSQ